MSKLLNIVFFTLIGICLTSISAIKARAKEPTCYQAQPPENYEKTLHHRSLNSERNILYKSNTGDIEANVTIPAPRKP